MSDTSSNANEEIVLVTEYFHPDTASTGQLMTDLAVGLQERGLNMTVYTGQPNYHSGENEQQPHESFHQDVLVKRISAPQTRQTSLSRRLFNWVVFTIWMFVTLLVSRPEGEREIVFVSNPPFLPTAMWLVCRLRGWDYTYVVHDLYPDQPVELKHLAAEGVLARTWAALNARALRDAEHVVALGPVMEERIGEQAGPDFDHHKVEIIHNWEDAEFIKPCPKSENPFSEEHGLVDPFTVLYSGNIGEFHDLETLVKAAARFDDENVRFVIIGEGDNRETIVDLAERLGVRGDTVTFLPYQPWEKLPYSLTAGDVSVVTVKEGFKGVCVSSKLYTAMAAGMPVLCIAQPDDDESRIVDQFEAGNHVKQGDIKGIVEAINRWQDDPDLVKRQGQNAREAFKKHFTREESVDAYYQLLTEEEPT